MKKVARLLALAIAKEATYPQPVEIISYGIEIILNLGTQLLILGTVSYFFGIFPTVMLSVAFTVIFRTFSGGNHFSSFFSCTSVSLFIFTTIGYFSTKFIFNNYLLVTIYIIISLFIIKWAPYNQIRKYSDNKIRKLKKICLLILCISLLMSFYLPEESFKSAIVLGLTWQTISITPFGISLIIKLDNFIHKKKER